MKIQLTRPLPTPESTTAQAPQTVALSAGTLKDMFDLQKYVALPILMHERDFFLDALQGEIDATEAMKKAKPKTAAYEQALDKWRIYRSLLNTMLRLGVNTEDQQGFPVINRAIAAGKQSLTKYLHQLGFPLESSGGLSFWQKVLLKEVQRTNATTSPKLINTALKKPGFNVNAALDEDGNQALPLAVKYNKHASIGTLLKAPGIQVDQTDHEGKTPLYWASERDQPDLVQELAKHGADPNRPDKLGHTPLHVAANLPSPVCAKRLLDNGKNTNPNVTDKDGNTPLHITALAGTIETTEALLKKGADPDKQNDAGESPTVWARTAKHPEVVELLDQYRNRKKLYKR